MEAEHPEEGRFRQVAPVLAGGLRDQPLHRVRTGDGTDADELLSRAGLAEDEIRKWRAEGAVE
jgi:hypothetical protein